MSKDLMAEYKAERIKMVNESRKRHGYDPFPEDHPVFGVTTPELPPATNPKQGEFDGKE